MIDAAAFTRECTKLWIKSMFILKVFGKIELLLISEPYFPSSERYYLQKSFLGKITHGAHIFRHWKTSYIQHDERSTTVVSRMESRPDKQNADLAENVHVLGVR